MLRTYPTCVRAMALFHPSCYAFSMQITVDVPDDFLAQAQARGLTPESYVRSLIEDAMRTANPRCPPAGKGKMDIKDFIRAFSAKSEKIPQLPDEAFTRESFYRDHD